MESETIIRRPVESAHNCIPAGRRRASHAPTALFRGQNRSERGGRGGSDKDARRLDAA